MTCYRVYSWHGAQLIAAQEIDAAGDVEAIRIARAGSAGDHSEIWLEGRRIRTVSTSRGRLQRA